MNKKKNKPYNASHINQNGLTHNQESVSPQSFFFLSTMLLQLQDSLFQPIENLDG